MSDEEERKPKGNPILDVVDKALIGVRKFLEEQKMLKLADELSYLALRKTLDLLKNTFVPAKIKGIEHLPDFKPAILASIADQPVDLFIAPVLTPRKVHLMLPWKMFETPGIKPLLESISAFRSTKSKDDMEPIQNVIKYLNEDKELVAMIPVDDGNKEALVKQFAGILKFAAGVPCEIIPYATTSLKDFKLGGVMGVEVAEPIGVDKRIKREERYRLAEEIVDKILAMKSALKEKPVKVEE